MKALLSQATAKAPQRNKASDGMCASQQHSSQNPRSDHEPDSRGLAHAGDVTHDPARFDIHREIREGPVKRRDPRVKYHITNRRIISSYPVGSYPAWAERPYHGANPHDKHGHTSIKSGAQYENDTGPWWTDEEDELAGEVGKQILAEVQALTKRVETIEDSVGAKYPGGPSIQKALVKYADVDEDPATPKIPTEHLNEVSYKLDELIATVGELGDAVRKLAEQHQP